MFFVSVAAIVGIQLTFAFQSPSILSAGYLIRSRSSQQQQQQQRSPTSCLRLLSMQRLWSSSTDADSNSKKDPDLTLRDRLRKATGFSFTIFRATIRGITGISLSAIYASTVAATGLWIRKVCSIILSIFPSWFRYFLQPFLVLYYAPLFMLRNLTGPTRQRAIKQHQSMLEGWKEAVEYAERTEKGGYWPVIVSEDGYFEMVAPPNPDDTTYAEENRQFSEAMAETVEHAMEVNDKEDLTK
jgi:hypothetical protein